MRNLLLTIILCVCTVSSIQASSICADTTKHNDTKIKGYLWLRQFFSILPTGSTAYEGFFEFYAEGVKFSMNPNAKKMPHIIGYAHLLKEIVIEWKEVAKIVRRGTCLRIFFDNMLFIKMKDGKKYFFLGWKKKQIIAEYKRYMASQTQSKK